MEEVRRYAEMKDSGVEWIGEIPSAWICDKAKHFFRQTNSRGNPTPVLLAATQSRGMCPQSMLEGVVHVSDDTDLQTFKTVHVNDFVISLRSFQGGFELSEYEGVCSPAYQTFHAIREIDIRYFRFFFKSVAFIDAMNALTVGIREGKNIKYEDFANSLIPIPPLYEQQTIASYLDKKCSTIDDIIASARTSVDDYKQLKASTIYEAVTKGLNPDVQMKDSGVEWIGEIPSHWSMLANKYIMKKKKNICAKWNGEDVLSLTMGGVIVRDIINPYGKMPATFDGYQYVESGNLLMCLFDIDVTPRCVGIIYNNGVTSPAYSQFVLKNNKNIKYYYFYYLMLDNTKELLHFTKNLRHSFTEEQFGQIKALVPPIEEQQAIADYLDTRCAEIDSLIAEKEALIADLEAYKKSLIYECVTGKRRVTEDSHAA